MSTRAEVVRARRKAIGGRRLRCRKGKSCSAACINRDKHCLVEAPTPVAGALPKAVKAIQSRKEKLGPREKRQASQKRKEYAKEKVGQSAKIKERKRKYIDVRSKLVREVQYRILMDDKARVLKLLERLERVEREAGSKLGVPKLKPFDYDRSRNNLLKGNLAFKKALTKIWEEMRTAAEKGDRSEYNRWEKKLLALKGKAGNNPFWKYHFMGILRSDYKKGSIWNTGKRYRDHVRNEKLKNKFLDLRQKAVEAVNSGNRKEYNKIERALLKIESKKGASLTVDEAFRLKERGRLWNEIKIPQYLKTTLNSMKNSLLFGRLEEYNKLESKFIRARDAYLNKYKSERNKLSLILGSQVSIYKGQLISQHLSELKSKLLEAANSKDRRKYNKIEKIFLDLNPEGKKGQIWMEGVVKRAKAYLPEVRKRMEEAIRKNDRQAYNKAEKIFLKLEPQSKKGQVWRESRIKSYIPVLMGKLDDAALRGNRKEYNKLEKVLFKIDPYTAHSKGEIWRTKRVNLTLDKIKAGMNEAIVSNDRLTYNKLEGKLIRVLSKVSPSNVNDFDLRGYKKGYLWDSSKEEKFKDRMSSYLQKGARESVKRLTVSGNRSDFTVSSSILGNSLDVYITPNNSTSFTVNGSYTADPNMSKRESFAITREVTRQYKEIIGKMEDGVVFQVSAASGDGREDMRIDAYVSFGFSNPDSRGRMFGVVREGRMEPISEDDYYDARAKSGLD